MRARVVLGRVDVREEFIYRPRPPLHLDDRWARATAPLRVVTAGVEVFDAPSFLVYLGVRKTASLERAYARLRREAKLRGLRLTREWQAIAPEDWKPHLSLAYRSRLRGDAWERIRSVALSLSVEAASCLVPTIEVLAYEEDGEHRVASYPLGAVVDTIEGAEEVRRSRATRVA